MNYKKKLSPEFKAKVALEAIQETLPLAEIAKKYEIAPSVVAALKEEFLSGASGIFAPKKEIREQE